MAAMDTSASSITNGRTRGPMSTALNVVKGFAAISVAVIIAICMSGCSHESEETEVVLSFSADGSVPEKCYVTFVSLSGDGGKVVCEVSGADMASGEATLSIPTTNDSYIMSVVAPFSDSGDSDFKFECEKSLVEASGTSVAIGVKITDVSDQGLTDVDYINSIVQLQGLIDADDSPFTEEMLEDSAEAYYGRAEDEYVKDTLREYYDKGYSSSSSQPIIAPNSSDSDELEEASEEIPASSLVEMTGAGSVATSS